MITQVSEVPGFLGSSASLPTKLSLTFCPIKMSTYEKFIDFNATKKMKKNLISQNDCLSNMTFDVEILWSWVNIIKFS